MLNGASSSRAVSQLSMHESVQQRIQRIEREPLPKNIWALLEEVARKAPEKTAWCFFADNDSISYGQLRIKVEMLAAGLQEAGVSMGTHVGVMLPNVSSMPLTWLALARLGAVMIPVNTRFTGTELHYALDDGEAEFFVTDEAGVAVFESMPTQIAQLAGKVFVVGSANHKYASWQGLLQTTRQLRLPTEPDLDAVMNIQYTSGTTGFPKGCVLTQRYWLTCAKTYSAFDGLQYDRILADNPFFYMTPQWLLLMAFFQGATLFVSPRLSARKFSHIVRTYGINYCLFREAYFHNADATPLDAQNELLRMNLYPHQPQDHVAMEERFNCPIRPAFGMTEIGVGLITPISATDKVGSGSCGMAAPFRECRIADAHGNTLPTGQTGELLVRGPGMLKEYYRKPGDTKQSFHGDWFRTGDLARCDAEGYYYIVGRIKDMIKRSGENIAAAEVEAVVSSLSGVAEAAALGVPDADRGEEVKIYLVLAQGYTPDQVPPSLVIEHCQKSLAAFKLPRYIAYRRLPLPRTASGKITKQPLRAEQPDLRDGSWDRLENRWLPESLFDNTGGDHT